MSRKDKYHEEVKQALIKDGWKITHDPFEMKIESFTTLKVDLGAERLLKATKENEKIAVEVKSFLGLSQITDLYDALGKFNVYVVVMKEKEPERTLYLAIPLSVKKTLLRHPTVQNILKHFEVKIIIINVNKKKIVEWIK